MPARDKPLIKAHARGVAVIENAAEAIGSEECGRLEGGFVETSVFSFRRSKSLTTGEGGVFVTDRHDLYERTQSLCDHARQVGDVQILNAESHTSMG